ncbi:indole-3-glycerol-phosphate synthase TrpC, partial [bacterium]
MILDDIVRKKREEVSRLGEPDLRNLHPSNRNFTRALQSGRTAVAIVAEIKKASPSAGVIVPDFDPAAIAADYAEGGAAAISVLTDAPFFQGSIEDLSVVSRTTLLPIL